MDQSKRICWKCKVEKDILMDFARGGKDKTCKKCRQILNREWAAKNPDKVKPKRAEYMRAWRKKRSEGTS